MHGPGNPESVEVRRLTADDWNEWRSLWNGYLTFYKTQLPPAVYESSFERLVSTRDNEFEGLVAVDKATNKLIGLAHYLFHRHGWKVENVCYLQDLFVSPDARGRGVGRALIAAVYAKADSAGSPDVYWMTENSNSTARLLYDKVGTLTPFIKYKR